MRLSFLCLLAGCALQPVDLGYPHPFPEAEEPGAEPALFAPPSNARTSGVVASPDNGHTLLVADSDNHEVLVVHGGALQDRVYVGGEPSRLVTAKGHLYMTTRASGEVVHVAERASGWGVMDRGAVGAEPVGLALVDGVLMVALSQEEAVVALDPDTLDELWRVEVPGEPRWMVGTNDDLGRAGVIVVSARDGLVHWVTLEGDVSSTPLPTRRRHSSGDRQRCTTPRRMAVRSTGDPSLLPDGTLWVPALHVDNDVRAGLVEADCQQSSAEVSMYAPEPSPEPEHKVGMWNPSLQGFVFKRGVLTATDTVLLSANGAARGVATSTRASVGPEGPRVEVAMEASDLVATVELGDRLELDGGFVELPVSVTMTEALPWVGPTGARTMVWSLEYRSLSNTAGTRRFATTQSLVPLDVQRGRRLFNNTNHSGISVVGAGVSCANCHTDGRNDGLTWLLEEGDRQTPSLAGVVSETMPATWSSRVPSVEAEARLTMTGRMGGVGLSSREYADLESYVDWTRAVKRPRTAAPEVVAEGEALFHDAEVGCATCHTGTRGTDNEHYRVFNHVESTNTPGLAGVGATAPYLHDGSLATLEDVVRGAHDGSMGNTGHLNDDQVFALVAFLEQWD